MSVIEIRAPFFHGRLISSNCRPLTNVPSLSRAQQAFNSGDWGAAVHYYKIAFRYILNGRRERPVSEVEMAAARNLQIARQRLAAQLRREGSSCLPPQLIMVHVSRNFGGGGGSVEAAHRRLLAAFPPEQVWEMSAASSPYLGHHGSALSNDATDHYFPGRVSEEIVLTGGAFGQCHYNDFRARVDQLAENAFLLGKRAKPTIHMVGTAIFYFHDADRGALNLHERRAADLEQLREKLDLYARLGGELEPGYSLPIDIRVSPTAGEYLKTSCRG